MLKFGVVLATETLAELPFLALLALLISEVCCVLAAERVVTPEAAGTLPFPVNFVERLR